MNTADKQQLLSHPLALIGIAFAVLGGMLFVFFLVLDVATEVTNPYASLLNFIVAPAVVLFGVGLVLLSIWRQVYLARRRGELIALRISIDASSPYFRRVVYGGFGVFAVMLIIVGYTGVKAYHTVESVDFCGKTCHAVMEPQYVAYQNSPHARVKCVECHVGSGFEHWIKSKIAGVRQIYAAVTESHEKPIPTPVHTLRPAQETCESCHWPRQFYGRKFVTHTYYKTDELNSPWTVDLLIKIGGGNPRTGKLEGIHWHMLEGNTVEYIALDEKRQQIPWVRVVRADGEVITYTQDVSGEEEEEEEEEQEDEEEGGGEDTIPDPDDPDITVRRFDCMDCHNRPSHQFLPPAKAVNLALSQRRISPELPYVRKKAVELLMADYDDREVVEDLIPTALTAFYQEHYPEIAENKAEDIDKAGKALVVLYRENFFPEMKTDYRSRINNLSHFTDSGCFRCHNGNMVNNKGERLEKNCSNCHLIVAQGPSANLVDLQQDIRGLKFKHPEKGGAWKRLECTECHTSDSGY